MPAKKFEVLAHAQVTVERKLLGHVADRERRGAGGLIQVEPGDAGAAGGRPQQAAHHLERGRFASAIRAEQAEDLAAANAKADPIGGREVPKSLVSPSACTTGAPSRPACWGVPARGDTVLSLPPSKSMKASSNRGGAGLTARSARPARSRPAAGPLLWSPGERCFLGSRRR